MPLLRVSGGRRPSGTTSNASATSSGLARAGRATALSTPRASRRERGCVSFVRRSDQAHDHQGTRATRLHSPAFGGALKTPCGTCTCAFETAGPDVAPARRNPTACGFSASRWTISRPGGTAFTPRAGARASAFGLPRSPHAGAMLYGDGARHRERATAFSTIDISCRICERIRLPPRRFGPAPRRVSHQSNAEPARGQF